MLGLPSMGAAGRERELTPPLFLAAVLFQNTVEFWNHHCKREMDILEQIQLLENHQAGGPPV